jgi:hypothetical protein
LNEIQNQNGTVCAVLIAVPADAAIMIIMLGTEVQAQDALFPPSVVLMILAIGIAYMSSK